MYLPVVGTAMRPLCLFGSLSGPYGLDMMDICSFQRKSCCHIGLGPPSLAHAKHYGEGMGHAQLQDWLFQMLSAGEGSRSAPHRPTKDI